MKTKTKRILDFPTDAESWKQVIKSAEEDGYEKGKKEEREKLTEIINWLNSIVWCNSHDTAWIEETINKLQKINEEKTE